MWALWMATVAMCTLEPGDFRELTWDKKSSLDPPPEASSGRQDLLKDLKEFELQVQAELDKLGKPLHSDSKNSGTEENHSIDNFISEISQSLKELEKSSHHSRFSEPPPSPPSNLKDEILEQHWWKTVYQYLKEKEKSQQQPLNSLFPQTEIFKPNSMYEVVETLFLFLLTIFVLCLYQQIHLVDSTIQQLQTRLDALERKRVEVRFHERSTICQHPDTGDDAL